MNMQLVLGLLLAGFLVGVISGMIGIGGGVLVIPILTFFFAFTHRQAVGTSLGMLLPPIGIFAFLQFYRVGLVDIRAAAILAVAFALGAWLGGGLAASGKVPEQALRFGFALFMFYVAGSMLFKSDPRVWAVVRALTLTGSALAAYLLLRRLARRWDLVPSAPDLYRTKVKGEHAPDYEI